MGCNCKQVKKIDKNVNKDSYKYTKKGFRGKLYFLWESFIKLLNALFICCLIILLVPIIISVIIWTFLFKGRAYVPFPKKLLKPKNSNENKIESEIEEIIDGEELQIKD